MEMDNTNQQAQPTQTPVQTESSYNPIANQKGTFLIPIGVVLIILIVGVGAYLLGLRQNQSSQNSIQQTITTAPVSTPVLNTKVTSKYAVFMRKGEIWTKDFTTNQEKKISKTAKVGSPKLSPSGKHLYYFQIVHAGGGFPRYSLFISDIQGQREETFSMGANHYASKLKWSNDGNYLGMVLFANDIPGSSQYYEEVFIYDTNTQKEVSLGRLTKGTSEGDAYQISASCENLLPRHVTFCKEYVAYIAVPRNNEYKGDYKSEEYSKSKYTKPNYILTRSEKLDNGLVVLEYYTGEPQNPESKWGIGGGVFVPGYDEGVTQTYTILLNEIRGEVIQEIPLAIDTDFLFQ